MTSKIVIRDTTNAQNGLNSQKSFKVIKLTNYKNFKILGKVYNSAELGIFLDSLPNRITYEILGEQ
jgi:hypothetical protein